MGTPPDWGLEHRASNPVSVKNLTAIETSTVVKLRSYVPVGTKRTNHPPTWLVKKFPVSRNVTAHHHVNTSPPMEPILNQFNPVHPSTLYVS
jgi:hypothetical protein